MLAYFLFLFDEFGVCCRQQAINQSLTCLACKSALLQKEPLEQVAFSFAHTHEQKVTALLAWLETPSVVAFGQLQHTAQQLRRTGSGSTAGSYYRIVEERSRALQRRVGEILRLVDYEGEPANALAQALVHYRERAGNVSSPPPATFLKVGERAALNQAESPVSLYKALLAGHVADQLKAGKLNLAHSFQYRPLDTYLGSSQNSENIAR